MIWSWFGYSWSRETAINWGDILKYKNGLSSYNLIKRQLFENLKKKKKVKSLKIQ